MGRSFFGFGCEKRVNLLSALSQLILFQCSLTHHCLIYKRPFNIHTCPGDIRQALERQQEIYWLFFFFAISCSCLFVMESWKRKLVSSDSDTVVIRNSISVFHSFIFVSLSLLTSISAFQVLFSLPVCYLKLFWATSTETYRWWWDGVLLPLRQASWHMPWLLMTCPLLQGSARGTDWNPKKIQYFWMSSKLNSKIL